MATKEQPSKAAIAASVETPKPAAKLVTLQSILRKVSPKKQGMTCSGGNGCFCPITDREKSNAKAGWKQMLDPGRSVKLNQYTSQIISTALIAATSDVNGIKMDVESTSSRTDLDSHTNMVVVRSNCLVIERSGRTASVNRFTPDYES
jgi:hypothetical protein